MTAIAVLLSIGAVSGFILWVARSFAQAEKLRNERDVLEDNLRAEDERKKINSDVADMSPNERRLHLAKYARRVPRVLSNKADSG